jgi:hypothetical protein
VVRSSAASDVYKRQSQNKAEAEAAPLLELAKTLKAMYAEGGEAALSIYLRNASLPLREKASETILKL